MTWLIHDIWVPRENLPLFSPLWFHRKTAWKKNCEKPPCVNVRRVSALNVFSALGFAKNTRWWRHTLNDMHEFPNAVLQQWRTGERETHIIRLVQTNVAEWVFLSGSRRCIVFRHRVSSGLQTKNTLNLGLGRGKQEHTALKRWIASINLFSGVA